MPGMNGQEALSALQKIEPQVNALITSGYAEQEVARSFPDSGPWGSYKSRSSLFCYRRW